MNACVYASDVVENHSSTQMEIEQKRFRKGVRKLKIRKKTGPLFWLELTIVSSISFSLKNSLMEGLQ